MSRSSAALAYDTPPIAPPRATGRHTAVNLLGGNSQGAYRPTASTHVYAPAAALADQRGRYLHLVRQGAATAAYAPEIAEVRPRFAHPVWLLASAVCVVALVLVISGLATRGRDVRYVNRLAFVAAQGAPDAPVIDTTSPAQKADEVVAPVVQGSQKYEVTGQPSVSVGQIEAVLQRYGSPAVGKGQALYDLGVKYGIDPAYALAFFVHESGCGTKGVARFTHSLGNIRWTQGFDNYEGYRSYPTWEAGMEDWYKLITDLYINGWGLRTVDAIVPRYAPSADSNDPPAYVASVKWLVDSWRGK